MFKTIKANLALISVALYTSAQLMANVLSTKIAILPWLNLSMDGGTVIYPLTFTLRDFVHKTCGKRNSRVVVVTAALINLLMVALFWLVGKLTPDPSWLFQDAYQSILMPVTRIVIASVISQIISELIDTEVFSKIYHLFSDILGSLLSNAVALVADSILFCLIAFAGVLPWSVVISIIISNILVKFVLSTVSAPLIKLVPRTVSEEEI
ncbi:MAG: queuosine precursor transporter [Patescibacteria group bacterium]